MDTVDRALADRSLTRKPYEERNFNSEPNQSRDARSATEAVAGAGYITRPIHIFYHHRDVIHPPSGTTGRLDKCAVSIQREIDTRHSISVNSRAQFGFG